MKSTIKTTIAILLLCATGCVKEGSKISTVSQSNSSNSVAAFQIGQAYNGGIIFYIDGSGQHGLIVSTTDLVTNNQSAQISWKKGHNVVTGASGTAVGTGASNTQKIVNALGTTGQYAALLCNKYKSGVYKDWYLPSKDELNLLYQQKAVIGVSGQYWSSSEASLGKAWDQEFGGGFQFKDRKSFTLNVRAVSAF